MFRSLIFLLAAALPLRADRIRVIVAVGAPELSAFSGRIEPLRADVIDSIGDARDVVRWGDGPAFAAEIDREDLERLMRDPRVRAVEPDDGGIAALNQSVPLIGADSVRLSGFDGSGVTVAVVDSGIDLTHAAFAGRIADQQCFCENRDGSGCCPNGAKVQAGAGSAADDYGHGTHVAGIIASGGGAAPRGVAPGVRVVAVKVLNRDGELRSFTQIYKALEWINANHPEVRVINMSLGSTTLYATESACDGGAVALGLSTIIDALRARGVLITASSGNQRSSTTVALPACMSDVLGVGATWDAAGSYSVFSCAAPNALADEVACFTNSNSSLDLLAPGAPILSSWRGGGTNTGYGTSMAAPHVAGVIALMLQFARGHLTADEIVQILEVTGRPVLDSRNGLTFPRVDAAAAIAATPRPPAPPRMRSVRH